MDAEWFRERHQETLFLIENSESARDALRDQQKELEARILEATADLEELHRHAMWLARKAGIDQTGTLPVPVEAESQEPREREAAPAKPGSETTGGARHHADVIEEVLRDAGHPLRVGDIITMLNKRGHPLPEDSSIRFNTVYSSMKRRPRVFVRLGMGRWGLVARDSSPIVWGESESKSDEARPETEPEDQFADLNHYPA
jgi:hypothetical protein